MLGISHSFLESDRLRLKEFGLFQFCDDFTTELMGVNALGIPTTFFSSPLDVGLRSFSRCSKICDKLGEAFSNDSSPSSRIFRCVFTDSAKRDESVLFERFRVILLGESERIICCIRFLRVLDLGEDRTSTGRDSGIGFTQLIESEDLVF